MSIHAWHGINVSALGNTTDIEHGRENSYKIDSSVTHAKYYHGMPDAIKNWDKT